VSPGAELVQVLTDIKNLLWWVSAALWMMLLFKDMGTGRRK
jgi:hypothetical protein